MQHKTIVYDTETLTLIMLASDPERRLDWKDDDLLPTQHRDLKWPRRMIRVLIHSSRVLEEPK